MTVTTGVPKSVYCLLLLTSLAAICGCPQKHGTLVDALDIDYEKPLPPGELALRKITDPAEVPDFASACADKAGLKEAVAHSLSYLAKPSSRRHFPYGTITHEQAVASLTMFQTMLDAPMTPRQMNMMIREKFDVYVSVGADGRGAVLFTGYYTPILQASPVRTDRFRYPLYKAPPGLVKNPDGTPASPMPDRRTIETSGIYAGNELAWLADPFEAYVAHVQGSARLQMSGGRVVTVGYAANNGHDYRSIRQELVNQGKVPKYAGLGRMMEYFLAHPEEVAAWTHRNPRFVFFQELAGEPLGSLNEPVTPMRSIATDKSVYPRASLAFIAADLPTLRSGQVVTEPYRGFALDQDAGNAIRAAGRCDVYMGVGDQAGRLAGQTQQQGRLYYLFLKASQP